MIISQTDVFSPPIIGSFGNFKTEESYELYYLMATLTLQDLDLLTTASKVLDFNTVSFEEMVQRDIDYARVDNDIVKGYLEKGKDKVIFFPPLLVTIMSIEDGKPINKYTSIDEDVNKVFDNFPHYSKTWDKDKFELLLPKAEQTTGYEIFSEKEKKNISYHHYAAKIRLNRNLTKLVVIDGQHRFTALKRILENKEQHLLKDIKIPICIFFSPNAVKETTEEIQDSMRELFVTINNTAKQVGGHFLTLLNDRSLSSMAIRSLANSWKGIMDDHSDCKLYFLEWNQRESKISHQITRKYSISTISIIAEALKEYLFKDLTRTILNLQEISEELLSVEEGATDDIAEDNFLKSQVKLIKKQIESYVTPALEILFLEFSPYKEVQTSFDKALSKLKLNTTAAAKSYYEDVLLQFRETTNYDLANVKAVEETFNSDIQLSSNDFYFRNVFQTGLIFAWSSLCSDLIVRCGILPFDIANAFISVNNAAINEFKIEMFDPEREFTQNVIFSGQRILVNKNSKEKTGLLLLAILLNKSKRDLFISKMPSDIKECGLDAVLESIAKNAFETYMNYFEEMTFKKIKKDWRFMGLSDELNSSLDYLEKKAITTKLKEDIENYHSKIDDIVLGKKSKAEQLLANQLKVKL